MSWIGRVLFADPERKTEELEIFSEKQGLKIGQLRQEVNAKHKAISMMKDNIASLEASLKGMSEGSSTLADELEMKDAQIKELTKEVEALASQIVNKQPAGQQSPATQVSDLPPLPPPSGNCVI